MENQQLECTEIFIGGLLGIFSFFSLFFLMKRSANVSFQVMNYQNEPLIMDWHWAHCDLHIYIYVYIYKWGSVFSLSCQHKNKSAVNFIIIIIIILGC